MGLLYLTGSALPGYHLLYLAGSALPGWVSSTWLGLLYLAGSARPLLPEPPLSDEGSCEEPGRVVHLQTDICSNK